MPFRDCLSSCDQLDSGAKNDVQDINRCQRREGKVGPLPGAPTCRASLAPFVVCSPGLPSSQSPRHSTVTLPSELLDMEGEESGRGQRGHSDWRGEMSQCVPRSACIYETYCFAFRNEGISLLLRTLDLFIPSLFPSTILPPSLLRIHMVQNACNTNLNMKVVLVSTTSEKKTWSRPPIALDFALPMYTASGLRVLFLHVRLFFTQSLISLPPFFAPR